MKKYHADKITENLIERLNQVREARKKPFESQPPKGLALVIKILDEEILRLNAQLESLKKTIT